MTFVGLRDLFSWKDNRDSTTVHRGRWITYPTGEAKQKVIQNVYLPTLHSLPSSQSSRRLQREHESHHRQLRDLRGQRLQDVASVISSPVP